MTSVRHRAPLQHPSVVNVNQPAQTVGTTPPSVAKSTTDQFSHAATATGQVAQNKPASTPPWMALKDGKIDLDKTFRNLWERGNISDDDVGAIERALGTKVGSYEAYTVAYWTLVEGDKFTADGKAAADEFSRDHMSMVRGSNLKDLVDRFDLEKPDAHRAALLGSYLREQGVKLDGPHSYSGVKADDGKYVVLERAERTAGQRQGRLVPHEFPNAAALLEHYGLRGVEDRDDLKSLPVQQGTGEQPLTLPPWMVVSEGHVNMNLTVDRLNAKGNINGDDVNALRTALGNVTAYDSYLINAWRQFGDASKQTADGKAALQKLANDTLPNVQQFYLQDLVGRLGTDKPDAQAALTLSAYVKGTGVNANVSVDGSQYVVGGNSGLAGRYDNAAQLLAALDRTAVKSS